MLHLRTRLGTRNEAMPGFFFSDDCLDPCEEILFVNVGFEGAAGFAGDDEQRALQVDLGFNGFDLRGISGVEDMQLGKSFDLAEGNPQDFRAKARTSHAEQKRVLESSLLYFGSKRSQSAAVCHLVIGDAKPAEPMILVGSGPKPTVAPPQTPHLLVLLP